MGTGTLLNNVILIMILFGGPLLPLLIIAIEVEHWHREHPEPDGVGEEPRHGH